MSSQLGKPVLDSDSEMLPLEISRFTYLGLGSPQHWFPFLRRTKLRHFSTTSDEWLFAQLLSGDPFPCVTRLELRMDESTLFANLGVLASFPATEVLTIHSYGRTAQGSDLSGRDRTPLFGVLTLLKEYEGPDDLLDVLLPLPSLHRLILPTMIKPDDQLAKLRAINAPNHITSLDLHFFDFDYENLCDLCGFFPYLTNLRIKVTVPHLTKCDYDSGEEASWEVNRFFQDLAEELPFPACFQKFAIHWEYDDERTHIEFGAPDLPMLKDAFVSKYPYMKAIWADGSPGFLYHWKLGEAEVQYYGDNGGDDEEGSDEDYWEDADKLRKQLKALWDTLELLTHSYQSYCTGVIQFMAYVSRPIAFIYDTPRVCTSRLPTRRFSATITASSGRFEVLLKNREEQCSCMWPSASLLGRR
ncbi:hypothetical protein B0H12DRAFT_850312 [Mycena haematopus]|nr:hypothetical protein B0H12DRAFT_850312 [Mycena haematopus]